MSPAELMAHLDELIGMVGPEGKAPLLALLAARVSQLSIELAVRPEPRASAPDQMLTIAEAAARLGVSESFLYQRRLPFRVKVGRRLLFSSNGIERYVKNRIGNS